LQVGLPNSVDNLPRLVGGRRAAERIRMEVGVGRGGRALRIVSFIEEIYEHSG
jgi:hypothetical protein